MPRPLHLTPELLARVDRIVDEPGKPSDTVPLTQDERLAVAKALLAQKGDGPF